MAQDDEITDRPRASGEESAQVTEDRPVRPEDDAARMRSPMRDENRDGERSEREPSDRMSDEEMREHNASLDAERDDQRARGDDIGHAERSMPPDDPQRARADVERGAGKSTLIPGDKAEGFQQRWSEVQTRFVDDPRDAVQQADSLVDEVMTSITKTFADERGRLEQQWSEGGDIGTEELRVALQRYRSFFERLLAT